MTIKGWPDSRRPVEPIGGWGPGYPGAGNVSGLPNIARRLDRAHPINLGLCGWWPMDEMQGTRIRDLSIYGNHGTLTNAADPPTATSGWGAGVSQRELSLDGTNDYISVPHSASLAVTGALTLSAWVYVRSTPGYGFIVGKYGTPTAYAGPYSMQHLPGGVMETYRGTGSGHSGANSSSPTGIATNAWVHVVFTDNLSTGLLYWNAAQIHSSSTSGFAIADAGQPVWLGRRTDGNYVVGQLAHVRIYNRALSATEIKQLYADQWVGSIGGIT